MARNGPENFETPEGHDSPDSLPGGGDGRRVTNFLSRIKSGDKPLIEPAEEDKPLIEPAEEDKQLIEADPVLGPRAALLVKLPIIIISHENGVEHSSLDQAEEAARNLWRIRPVDEQR